MGKAFKEARTKAMKAVCDFWFQEIRPRHFTESAKSRYQYHARTKKYEERKFKRFGHTRPLVYTGTMERVLAQSVTIKASSKRGEIQMAQTADNWLKGYISFRGKNGTGPDKWLELQRIPPDEQNELAAIAAKILREAIKNAKGNPPDMGADL
jgi:hypothetical protein